MGKFIKKSSTGEESAPSFCIEPLEGRQMLSAGLPSHAPAGLGVQPGQGIIIHTSAGDDFTGDVATFNSSIVQGMLGATIDWGDGTQSNGEVITRTGYPVRVAGIDHVYSRAGIYTTTITISDAGQQSHPLSVVQGTADVGPARIVGRLIYPMLNQQLSEDFGSFSPGPQAPNAVLSGYIDWGDGRTSVGVIRVAGDGSFHVWGYHRYRENGYFHLSVNVYSIVPRPPVPPGTITPFSIIVPIPIATFLATAHVYNRPFSIVVPPLPPGVIGELFPILPIEPIVL
ncbi:MAG: PKD domain-containing protein [Planctomycetota bacterium]|nr:PKD domain-containing protein [Planctomycetota bacterium]